MIKSLMVVTWYTPKKEKVLTAGVFHNEQSHALKKYCNDVRIYWPFDESVKGLVKDNKWGIFTYRSEYDPKKKFFSLINAVKYLKKICDEYKPDILHAHCAYPGGLIAVIAGRQKGIPVALTEHCPMEQMKIDNLVMRLIRGFVYKNTAVSNICVSNDSMERLKKVYSKCNFQVIYNAIMNPDNFNYGDEIYRIEGSINCGIVAVFYDKTIKGYQYLIPAIKKVREKGIDIKLHICGGGQYEEFYKNMAKDLGIQDSCIFYGQLPRNLVYSIIRQMDFCVSASVFECSGVSVQEEMLLGKPVLVTKSGGANSLTTKYTSIVVDRRSEKALVNGLIEMSEKYKEFDVENIKKYAYENFEIENVTRQYFELYKEIMEKKK